MIAKHLYAGFTDAFTETEISFNANDGTAYWNDNIRSQVSVAGELDYSKLNADSMRTAGFTAALVTPRRESSKEIRRYCCLETAAAITRSSKPMSLNIFSLQSPAVAADLQICRWEPAHLRGKRFTTRSGIAMPIRLPKLTRRSNAAKVIKRLSVAIVDRW